MITAPAQILYDEDGNPVLVQLDGNLYKLAVGDEISQSALLTLVKEVRMLRMVVVEALGSSLTIEDTE